MYNVVRKNVKDLNLYFTMLDILIFFVLLFVNNKSQLRCKICDTNNIAIRQKRLKSNFYTAFIKMNVYKYFLDR